MASSDSDRMLCKDYVYVSMHACDAWTLNCGTSNSENMPLELASLAFWFLSTRLNGLSLLEVMPTPAIRCFAITQCS